MSVISAWLCVPVTNCMFNLIPVTSTSYYRATILEFLGDVSCVVNFDMYDTTDVCQ
ncbi:Survival of motor neuron-related-splicing factor 30, partial [Schistosoma japonicum]